MYGVELKNDDGVACSAWILVKFDDICGHCILFQVVDCYGHSACSFALVGCGLVVS